MPFETSLKNAMLDHAGSLCTYMALYTDAAGTTEVSGGTYARQLVNWNAANAASKSLSAPIVFNIPAGVTVASVGLCTAITGGTRHVLFDPTDESYGSAGTYTVNAAALNLT